MDTAQEIDGMDLPELLLVYGNWRSRLVPAQPRTVHVSHELSGSPRESQHGAALAEIKARIERGDDLTPYLSKGISVAHASSTRDKKARGDRDLLIADWKIHHMHLSPMAPGRDFVKRTGDLLFVRFGPADAFLIDVYPHGAWALQEMIRILVRNWPQERLVPEFAGISMVTQKSDEEHKQGREAGLTQPVDVDGRTYWPLGQTTAGTPIEVTQRANALLNSLREWEERPIERLRSHLTATSLPRDKIARWMATSWRANIDDLDGREEVVLTNGRVYIPVGPLP